jgi:hypothetical protein
LSKYNYLYTAALIWTQYTVFWIFDLNTVWNSANSTTALTVHFIHRPTDIDVLPGRFLTWRLWLEHLQGDVLLLPEDLRGWVLGSFALCSKDRTESLTRARNGLDSRQTWCRDQKGHLRQRWKPVDKDDVFSF